MKFLVAFAFLLFAWGCSDDTDRQEVVQKLRGLGASSSPLVAKPSVSGSTPQQVELTVYAALPLGHVAEIKPYRDEDSIAVVMLEEDQIQIQADSVTYQDYPETQILSFKALLSVPNAEAFAAFGGGGQVRYGFLIKDGTEEEKIIGNFLVYPEGSPQLAWSNPEVDLTAPIPSVAANSKVDLSASLSNPNNEELGMSWFVTGGEIVNRRAKDTEWKTPGPGAHTLIVTVRGKSSRGFGIKILSVNAE